MSVWAEPTVRPEAWQPAGPVSDQHGPLAELSVPCWDLGRRNNLLYLAWLSMTRLNGRHVHNLTHVIYYRDFIRLTLVLCGSVHVLTLIPISPIPSLIGASIAPLFNFLFILDLVSATLLFLSSFARNPPSSHFSLRQLPLSESTHI